MSPAPAPTTRRVSAVISKGLLTETTNYSEGGFPELHDCFISRLGEIEGRWPRRYQTTTDITTTATNVSMGCGVAEYHPDLGVCANFGILDDTTAVSQPVTDSSITTFEYQVNPITSINKDRAWASTAASADWTNLGTSAKVNVTPNTSLSFRLSECAAKSDDEIFFGERTGGIWKWGGSNNASASAASASGAYWAAATNRVSGISTSWSTQLEAGMYIQVDGLQNSTTTNCPAWRVVDVLSDTEIVIDRTLASAVASASRLAWRAVPIARVGGGRDAVASATWSVQKPEPRTAHGILAYHDHRLFAAAPADGYASATYNYSRLKWSFNTSDVDGAANYWARTDGWGANGYVDVYPGIGGFITGLVSLGNELVVLKTDAICRVTGTVNANDKGSAGVQVVNRSVGAAGPRSWALTPIGIVFANRMGVYVYDGNAVKSLTAGKVDSAWRYFAENRNRFSVNCVENQIYCGIDNTDVSQNVYQLVYDIERDAFWSTFADVGYRSCIEVRDINDNHCGWWAFLDHPYVNQTKHIYHNLEFDTRGARNDVYPTATLGDQPWVGTTATTPTPTIAVNFPIGEAPFTEGRFNTFFVECRVDERSSGASAYMSVSAMMGNFPRYARNLNYPSSQSFAASVVPDIGTTIGSTAANGTVGVERSYRIPIDGTNYAGDGYILLVFNYGINIRILALGVDGTFRNVTQANYKTGD